MLRELGAKSEEIHRSSFSKTFFVPTKVNTRNKENGLIPTVYARTKPYQRSLKISIQKLHKWLKENSLLPEYIGKN